jgi:protein FAM50
LVIFKNKNDRLLLNFSHFFIDYLYSSWRFFQVNFLFCYERDVHVDVVFLGASKDQMRADQLLKRRQQEHEQMEMKKKKIEEENRMQAIEEKFKAHYDAVEQMLKTDTVGLVSLDEMKKKQEEIIHAREQQLAREKEAKLNESMKNKQDNRKGAGAHQRPNKLSFADEWEEEEEEE